MSKKYVILLGGVVAALLCCAAVTGVASWQIFSMANNANLTTIAETATPIPVIEREPVSTPIVAAPVSTLVVTATQTAVPPTGQPDVSPTSQEHHPASPDSAGLASPLQLTTEQLLTQAVLPERNQRLLAMRLKYNGQDIPLTIDPVQAPYQLGQVDTFWVTDNTSTPPNQFEVEATLAFIGDHSYWWVQNGMNVNAGNLERAAQQFDSHIYPTTRAFFGSEWSPGIDNDARVHIFMGNVPGVAGYFSASNSFHQLAEPYSNEREMFFINLSALSPGTERFDNVLAHEFQHMIHWYEDKNEDAWVNEGLSELSTFINGYGIGSFVGAYMHSPDTQLNSWSSADNSSFPHYGGSFLFMAYFLQRFGEDVTKAVVANPNNGIAGFNDTLASYGYDETFDTIFADFLTANVLNDVAAGQGFWGYHDLAPGSVEIAQYYDTFPVENKTTVHQYGGDYVTLVGDGNITIVFTGSTRVPVLDNQAHSGSYQWYSHRGDDTNTRLTHAFDLSNVASATLNYWTWYDIETDWDYVYLEISTNGGETWTILPTPHSSTSNPSGNAFGPGYTGASGNGPTWLEESIDLSQYAGQQVHIRFEMVTDDAVNHPGFAVDDISIPEIGFFDDVESGPNQWIAEGFVLIDNVLPQHFIAQVLEVGDEVTLRPILLDETNYGTLTIDGLGSTVDWAVLMVSGLTPVTTQPASYEYSITQER